MKFKLQITKEGRAKQRVNGSLETETHLPVYVEHVVFHVAVKPIVMHRCVQNHERHTWSSSSFCRRFSSTAARFLSSFTLCSSSLLRLSSTCFS